MSTLTRVVLLTAPTTLSAQVVSPTRIDLSWPAVFGAIAYRVYRNGVLVDSPGGLTSSSTGLTSSTQYSFRVASVDQYGLESPQGVQIAATTSAAPDTTPPTAPVLGTPAQSGANSLIVTLTTASTDASGIGSYQLERGTSASGPWTVLSATATFPRTDTGLLASTRYYYRARATDNAGNVGLYSTVVNQITTSGFSGIRFTPGHYKYIDTGSGGGGQDGELAQIDAIGGKSYMAGVKWAPTWAQLEGNTRGDYSAGFATFDLYRNRAAAIGKKLLVNPRWQFFSESQTTISGKLPSYLSTIDNGSPGYYLWPGGTPLAGNLVLVVFLWKDFVNTAYIELGQAYAARYKDDPVVEMWATGETAIDAPSGTGYSHTLWITELKRWMTAMRAAWPNTAVRVASNYLGSDSQMKQILDHALVELITLGGPDNYSRAYQANLLFTGFTGGTDYRGRIPWASESQYPARSSGGPTSSGNDVSSSTIYNFNVSGPLSEGGGINPEYWVWFNSTFTNGGLYHTYPDETEPFIASINGATNTTIPSLYTGSSFFTDNFSSNSFSKQLNGFYWGGQVSCVVADVSAFPSPSGSTTAVRFNFRNHWAELNFDLGRNATHLFLGYRVYMTDKIGSPGGVSGSEGTNNKFLRIGNTYPEQTSNEHYGFSTERGSLTGGDNNLFVEWGGPGGYASPGAPTVNSTIPGTAGNNRYRIIQAANKNRWVKVDIEIKSPTIAPIADPPPGFFFGRADGIFRVWVDGVLVMEYTSAGQCPANGVMRGGYLFGYLNDRYVVDNAEDAYLYMTDFYVSETGRQ